MKTLEKCSWKLISEIKHPNLISDEEKYCKNNCDGYDNKCLNYTIIKEDCVGL